MAIANAEVSETEVKPKVSPFKDAFKKAYTADDKPAEVKPVEAKEVVQAPVEKPVETPINSLGDAFKNAISPKEEVKPVEATPKEHDKEQNISALRKAREEADKRATQAEARAKELEGKIPTDYETIKAERTKLAEERELLAGELKKFSVQSTPEFKEKFDKPLSIAEQQIEKAVLVDGGKADKVLSLLKQPESKDRNDSLSELMDELSPLGKSKVANAVADYDRIREQRESELSNPDQTLKLNQEAQVKQAQEQRKLWEREMDTVLDEVSSEFPWLKKGENASLNTEIDAFQDEARRIFLQPTNTKQQAQFAARAAMTPRLYKVAMEAYNQIGVLNAELAKARGATPTLEIKNPADSPKPVEGKGAFMSVFNKAMGKS